MRYHQITLAERYTLTTLRKQVPRLTCAAIARLMGRHPSTIARELRRNRSNDGFYRCDRAQEKTNRRRSHSKRTSRYDVQQWQLIESLLHADLSPEQISGRLRREGTLQISHETIYKRIWLDKRRGGHLYRRLRQRPKYRKRYGTYEKRGRAPGKRHISERPPAAELRREIGHWEMDTVIGTGSKDCIVSLVERATGCVLIGKLTERTVTATNRRIVQLLQGRPDLFKTITADNGTEFHGFREIEAATGVQVYFATPYHSWERGSNENTNGLIRQYLPKGTSMKALTQSQCDEIAITLNNRPRKRFGFLTPIEQLHLSSTHVGVAVQS